MDQQTTTNDDLLFDLRDGIGRVTFNRPQARNAFTFAMYERLAQICEQANNDRSIKVLVLTGAGDKAFASGTDINQFRAFTTPQHALDYEARIDRVLSELEQCRVPVIAAIAGACTGGGGGIAACCDIRIAAPSARYGFPIARTLGNCLSMQNYARAAALLGFARVKDLIMRARLMDASEMLACGMLSELTADEESLPGRAQALAEELASNAPLTLWATKEALRRVRDRLVPEDADSDLIIACYTSKDFHEGVESFLAKRKPHWTGE